MITCIILYIFCKSIQLRFDIFFVLFFGTKYLLYFCHVQPDWYHTQMLFIGLVTTTLIKVINTSVNAGTLQPLVWPPCSTLVVTPCNPSSTRPCSGRVGSAESSVGAAVGDWHPLLAAAECTSNSRSRVWEVSSGAVKLTMFRLQNITLGSALEIRCGPICAMYFLFLFFLITK